MQIRHIGKVIDNNSSDTNGACQIYIEYLHHDLEKDQYPWMKMDRAATSNIPEIDDYVWCWFLEEKFHKKGYYGNKINLDEYNEHNESIGSLTGSYPNIKYIKLANGCAIGMNSDSPEITIYHPSAEIFIDTNGCITIEDGTGTNKIEMNASGIKLTTGDASIWQPCSISACIFSGAPHGGTTAGITKLTGG